MPVIAVNSVVDGVNVEVVETKFMTQALECLVHYTEDRTIEENVEKSETLNQDIRAVLSNSFGFGGTNASLVITKY